MPTTSRARWSTLPAALALVVAVAACASEGGSEGEAAGGGRGAAATTTTTTAEPAPEATYPDPDWVAGDPAALGIDPAALDELVQLAGDRSSSCLVVTRDGFLVGEWYWNGWDATTAGEIFSASKSVTSTLVGIAQDRGELDVDEPASRYITEWQETPSEDVTIANLLGNDSGREWDLITDYVGMAVQATDKSAFAAGLGQRHEPGTVWEYNNAAIQNLETVLERATGRDVAEYAEEHLFGPTGMASTDMGRDAAGNTVAYAHVRSSCRDLARFGYLFLREGTWAGGEQVVSAEWVEEATSPSTDLNSAYGYLWWLNVDGHWVKPSVPAGKPEGDGRRVPDAPEDMFAAQGMGGQLAIVLPSTGVVVSRMGPAGSALDAELGGGDLDVEIETLAARLVPGDG